MAVTEQKGFVGVKMTITGFEFPFYLLLGMIVGWFIRAWWDRKDREEYPTLANKNSG
jgi:hypothetical protein